MQASRGTPGRVVISAALALTVLITGGSVALSETETKSRTKTKTVKIRDDCEPTSFNEAVGPGTCVGDGETTFAEFIEELREDRAVEAWRFNPRRFHVAAGTMLLLKSRGGETHTFTKVEDFGGGFVAGLNALSGNLVATPECAVDLGGGQLAPQPPSDTNIFVEAGETEAGPTAGSSILPVGKKARFQCCIHPWMHAVVTVTERHRD